MVTTYNYVACFVGNLVFYIRCSAQNSLKVELIFLPKQGMECSTSMIADLQLLEVNLWCSHAKVTDVHVDRSPIA